MQHLELVGIDMRPGCLLSRQSSSSSRRMFLADFCCGCCIEDGDGYDEYSRGRRENNNHHRRHHSRHDSQSKGKRRGYYKYCNQSERDANESRRHPQRRPHPPSSHKMSERLSSSSDRPRSESRRNDESCVEDEQWNSSSALPSRRRDEASVMAASLNETYQGYVEEADDEYMDEQSAIRRSLKDAKRSRKKADKYQKQYQSEPEEVSSYAKKTKLETHIEEKGRSQSQPRSRRIEDFENVTTISKASLNPYRVLGLRQGASPREVYDSYKQKQKETHPNAAGGSEKAFRDVSNAYRRLRAELKRQEARKERRNSMQRNNGNISTEQSTKDKSSKSSRGRSMRRRKHQNSDAEEDDNIDQRRVSIDERLKDHRALVHNLFSYDAKEHKMSSSSSVSSAGHVTTLQKAIYSQSRALMSLSLVPIEAGAVNINEQNKKIQNSCFYLSLAASYLSGAGAFETDPTAGYFLSSAGKNMASDGSVKSSRTLDMAIATLPLVEKSLTMSLALQLKRAIEAAVVLVHPNWASDGIVGEEVQAFSDFLVYALDSDSVLGHWAIAVFDEASGFVDVYRGRHYGKIYPPKKAKGRRYSSSKSLGGVRDSSSNPGRDGVHWMYRDCDEATKRAHTLTLRYIPGHYQPLLPELTRMKSLRQSTGAHDKKQNVGLSRPTLEDILATLEAWKVLHVVTDGRA